MITSILSAGLWWYASGVGDLVGDTVVPIQARNRTIQTLIPAVIFALSILIAWVTLAGAMYFWVTLVAVEPLADRFLSV